MKSLYEKSLWKVSMQSLYEKSLWSLQVSIWSLQFSPTVCCSVLQCVVESPSQGLYGKSLWKVSMKSLISISFSMERFHGSPGKFQTGSLWRRQNRNLKLTVLHCVALCCSVLQCVAVCDSNARATHRYCVVVCCNVLPHTATHCNTLPHTATHYNTVPIELL